MTDGKRKSRFHALVLFQAALISSLIFCVIGGCDGEGECDCHCVGCCDGTPWGLAEMVSWQKEAMQNMHGLYITQVSYYGEYGTYGHDFPLLGWSPEVKSHYAYFIDGDSIQPEIVGPYHLPAFVIIGTTQTSFTAAAVGNLDIDATLDVWTINEHKMSIHLVDDLIE